MAVSLWLFSAHFPAFQPFAEVENVLVVANGLHGRLAFAFQGEVYQFVHKLVEAYAGGFPQVEREGTGNGVDFVYIDVAALGERSAGIRFCVACMPLLDLPPPIYLSS